MYSFRDQLQPVLTGFLRFFAVPVRGSCILKLSGTGPVRSPFKKGNRTETRPDFKALLRTATHFQALTLSVPSFSLIFALFYHFYHLSFCFQLSSATLNHLQSLSNYLEPPSSTYKLLCPFSSKFDLFLTVFACFFLCFFYRFLYVSKPHCLFSNANAHV